MDGGLNLFRRFNVGDYECTLTFAKVADASGFALAIEWSPDLPKRLTNVEMAQYREGRNQALAELASVVGGAVAVVE